MPVSPEAFAKRFPQIGKHVPDAELRGLAAAFAERTLEPGNRIITAGARSDTLFLIMEGSVLVEIGSGGKVARIGRIPAGQWFGEIGLLDPGPATADVTAAQTTTVAALSPEAFATLQHDHPWGASSLLQALSLELAERLRATAGQLLKHASGPNFTFEAVSVENPGWLRDLAGVLAGISGVNQ